MCRIAHCQQQNHPYNHLLLPVHCSSSATRTAKHSFSVVSANGSRVYVSTAERIQTTKKPKKLRVRQLTNQGWPLLATTAPNNSKGALLRTDAPTAQNTTKRFSPWIFVLRHTITCKRKQGCIEVGKITHVRVLTYVRTFPNSLSILPLCVPIIRIAHNLYNNLVIINW